MTLTIPSTGSENGCKEEGEKGEKGEKGHEAAGKARGEKGRQEADTERRVHEASAAGCDALGGRRWNGDSAHRSDQEAVGLHPQERPPGREEPPHDQRRRQAESGVRRQGSGLDVRDDQARQQAREVELSPALQPGGTDSNESVPLAVFRRHAGGNEASAERVWTTRFVEPV